VRSGVRGERTIMWPPGELSEARGLRQQICKSAALTLINHAPRSSADRTRCGQPGHFRIGHSFSCMIYSASYALLARSERPELPSGHPYESRKSHDGDSIGFAAGDDAILAAASKILSQPAWLSERTGDYNETSSHRFGLGRRPRFWQYTGYFLPASS